MTQTSGTADPTVRPRLDSLTGARFVAALAVFIYHVHVLLPAEGVFGRAIALVGANGSVGVDFFFVLSGFVLAWSWRPGGSAAAFYRRRCARLAPAYVVALLYGLIWVVVLYREPADAVVHVLPSVIGIQAWFPDSAVHFAANGVEWSVSAELFFYSLFPVIVVFLMRRGGRAGLAAAAFALVGVAPLLIPQLLPMELSSWALNILPATRIGEFITGLLLAVFLQKGHRVRVGPKAATGIMLAAYLLLPLSPGWVPQRAVLVAAILLLIAALAQADLEGARATIASRVPVRLGEWSYCFYLVHQVTTQIVLFPIARWVPRALVVPVWLVAALAISIGLAALLHSVVERPLERRLRGSAKPGLGAQPTAHGLLQSAGTGLLEPSGRVAGGEQSTAPQRMSGSLAEDATSTQPSEATSAHPPQVTSVSSTR